jgi:hypothetical protein
MKRSKRSRKMGKPNAGVMNADDGVQGLAGTAMNVSKSADPLMMSRLFVW